MNRSQTKIRKIQEANKIAEERFLMSEQATPVNPVASKIPEPDPTKKPVSKKIPTDFNKNITFLFPDQTTVIVKPKQQDISKLIISQLGLGAAPQGNVFSLIKTNGAKKVCGTNPFTSKIYIFTKPNSIIDEICNVDNINPEYLSKLGIFAIPNKYEFAQIGTWKSNTQTTPQK
jgi:hypothetical protein